MQSFATLAALTVVLWRFRSKRRFNLEG